MVVLVAADEADDEPDWSWPELANVTDWLAPPNRPMWGP